MSLEYENQTPQSINDRMSADVKLSAPRSNPTKKNSFLGALIKGSALRIYDFYQQLKRLKQESFPDTSSWDGELKRWGNYRQINPNPETGAKGTMIATGSVGEVLTKGSTLTIEDVTYQTDSEVSISVVSYSLISLSRNGTTVTAKTASGHNLASSLTATITGANEAIFNGSFEIAVIDSTSFTYQVDGDDQFETATGLPKSAFNIAFVSVSVAPDSVKSGLASNQNAGTVISLNGEQDVDQDMYVSQSGLSGGADAENAYQYRQRVIDAYQNPIALFNEAAIEQHIKQNVVNATRVWIKPTYPEVGQVTIYFTADNTGVIPTNEDVENVKIAVYAIKPATTAKNDIFIYAPNPKYVDFDFATLSPNTSTMRAAIQSRLQELFYTSAGVETPLTAEDYRAKIKNTIDSTGASVTQYSLTNPIGDVDPGTGGIPVLRNVNFSDSTGEVFIPNLFDGQDGRSNGSQDGYSKEITGANQIVDVSVYGTFGAATATLQQYVAATSEWFNTSVVWNAPDQFQGLNLISGERYRIMISGVDGSTAISAEVYYG